MQTLERDDASTSEPKTAAAADSRAQGWLGRVLWAASAVVTGLFLVRVLGAPWPHFAQPFPETATLKSVARVGPFHPGFWFAKRAPLYPLFMWMLGRSTSLIVIAQAALYVGAVFWLCRAARSGLRTRGAYAFSIVFIVAIAIEARTARWTTIVLPEALSIVFAFALIAVWWTVAAHPSVRALTLAWVVTGAWLFLRDASQLPVALVIVPVVGVGAMLNKSLDPAIRRRAIQGAVVMLVLCAYVAISQHVGNRPGFTLGHSYSTRVQNDLPSVLRDDLRSFDASGVSNRLPDHFFAVLGEPRTTGVLWFEVALAGVALAIASIERRRRRLVLFGAAGLAVGIVDVFAAYGTARSEYARELAASRALLSLMIVVCLAIGVDYVLTRNRAREMAAPGAITLDRTLHWLTVVAMTALGFGAIFANWLRANEPDSQFAREIVVRVAKYGGTYYDNAVLNRGPQEEWFHSLASHISSYDGYWYTISAFVAIIALVLGFVVARTARATGAVRELALAAGIFAFMYFALGNAEYTGFFYVRNITTLGLALVWLLLVSDRPWQSQRSRTITAVAIGILLGFTVQLLVTAALVGIALCVVAYVMAGTRVDPGERVRLTRITIITGLVAFFSAPVYYFLRGDFSQFWEGFWTYATFMSRGTGNSLGTQFAQGWDAFYAYYHARPLAFLAVVAFLVVAWAGWPNFDTRTRVLHGGLLAWLAGAWIELTLTQRLQFQPQYYIVVAVPLALMAAALTGHAYRAIIAARGKFGRPAWYPLIAIALSVTLMGATGEMRAAQEASSFTSVRAHASYLLSQRAGPDRTFGAVLDLVSKPGDPLLAWTLDTWPYLGYHRVAATRFIWKSFLAGDIWQGHSGPQYILPNTWKWFADDVRQSKPVVFAAVDSPVPSDSPFTQYLNGNFTPIFDANNPLWYRNDVAQQILDNSASSAWQTDGSLPSGTSWKVDGNTARYTSASPSATDTLPIERDQCTRLEGDTNDPGMVFHLVGASPASEVRLTLDGNAAASGNPGVEFSRGPSGAQAGAPTHFALVVGRRAAAIVIGNRIRAVVDIPPHAALSIESRRTKLTLSNLMVGAAPAVSC
jgi:hypothetical protein